MRERLRGKLVRAVHAVAGRLEAKGQHERAIELYSRGLDADDLVEAFYQGLMRCYAKLGRGAEAIAIFRRLSASLGANLNAKPSIESQRLAEAAAGTRMGT